MTKKLIVMSSLLMFLLLLCGTVSAQDTPAASAFGNVGDTGDCGEISIQFMEKPKTAKSMAGVKAADTFISMKVQLIYISDTLWGALDKSSFELVNKTDEGEKAFPLNFAVSTLLSKSSGADALVEELVFPTLYNYYLVFDTEALRENWYLHFTPKERGSSDAPYCDLMLPIPAM